MSTPGKIPPRGAKGGIAISVGRPGLSELGRYRELVLGWLLARHEGGPLIVNGSPELYEGLKWMGLDFVPGPDGPAPPIPVGPLVGGEEVTLASLRQEGFIPEVVMSALAQTGWRGRSPDFTNVTRTELLVRFTPEGLLTQPVRFDLEQWRTLNRDRLQELTPAELLELARPFLKSSLPAAELEAAILMACEEVSNLVELAAAVSM